MKPAAFRAARRALGMTQEELAARSGYSKKSIENIENWPRPKYEHLGLDMLHTVAVTLSLDPETNICPVDAPPDPPPSLSLPFTWVPQSGYDRETILVQSLQDDRVREVSPMLLLPGGAKQLEEISRHLASSAREIGDQVRNGGGAQDSVQRLMEAVDRAFGTICDLEIQDLHSALQRKSIYPFQCTDSTLDTLDPHAWDNDAAFQRLRSECYRLAARYSLRFGRFTRAFILSTQFWSVAPGDHLARLCRLINEQLDAQITVWLCSRAAVHPEQVESLLNMYMVPGRFVLFGAQPVPICARFDVDSAIGRALDRLAQEFWECLRSAVHSGQVACAVNHHLTPESLRVLLSELGLVLRPDPTVEPRRPTEL